MALAEPRPRRGSLNHFYVRASATPHLSVAAEQQSRQPDDVGGYALRRRATPRLLLEIADATAKLHNPQALKSVAHGLAASLSPRTRFARSAGSGDTPGYSGP